MDPVTAELALRWIGVALQATSLLGSTQAVDAKIEGWKASGMTPEQIAEALENLVSANREAADAELKKHGA